MTLVKIEKFHFRVHFFDENAGLVRDEDIREVCSSLTNPALNNNLASLLQD